MELKDVKATLLKQGAEEIKGLTIKNAIVTKMPNYVRVGISLDKPIKAYVANEDGDYELGENNIIFVSNFSIANILRDNDDCCYCVNYLLEHNEALGAILQKAKISIIQQHIEEGKTYQNLFNPNADEVTFDHNVIINDVVSIELSPIGLKLLEKITDKILEL